MTEIDCNFWYIQIVQVSQFKQERRRYVFGKPNIKTFKFVKVGLYSSRN